MVRRSPFTSLSKLALRPCPPAWLPARRASCGRARRHKGGPGRHGPTTSSEDVQVWRQHAHRVRLRRLNASPGLTWTQPPAGTQSYALIMGDPDAAPRASVHWVVYDVPAGTRQISEAMPRRDELIDGTRQGLNDFGKLGYSGPCPAPGRTGRYVFKLYALDTKLDLKAPVTAEGLQQQIKGHVLAQAELTGRYARGEQSRSPK